MSDITRRSLLTTCIVSGGAAFAALLTTRCSAQTSEETTTAKDIARKTVSIPSAHPRLWWTPERLQQAQTWFRANPFTPSREDYVSQAFVYLVTGEKKYARSAIDWALTMTITDRAAIDPDPNGGVASDGARWYGEMVILIYDWCWAEMSAAERQILIDRWNGYTENLRRKVWGGLRMPQSNYFWGYLRNEFEWGVATWGDNPMADGFVDHALQARWTDTFLPHATTAGLGGVAQEGSQYGRYLLGYSVVPLTTARLMGRDLYGETDFFKSAVYYVVYATLPAPTFGPQTREPRFELFPANDDQFFRNGGSAQADEYGNFMANAAYTWRNIPTGEYARRWLSMTKPIVFPFVSSIDEGGIERDFNDLPFDYFAAGPLYFFNRSSWRPEATVIHLQLGAPVGAGHEHDDFGTWQMWRRGRWLSRETTGYSENIAGYAGRGTVGARTTCGHNGLLLNGRGLVEGPPNGLPVVRRMESRAAFTQAVVDLTPAYRNNKVGGRRERDNSVVDGVEREFVFLRPLETLVIFDRLATNDSVMPAGSVTKTFLAHFEQLPKIEDSHNVLGVNGDDALRLTTMLPPTPEYRIITEGSSVGQFRLEVETSGTPVSYFLHVLQAREAGGQSLNCSLEETSDTYILTISHPEFGFARVELVKASGSNGGGVGFSRTSMPESVVPFLDRVQEMGVTDNGPVWEQLPGEETVAPTASARTSTRQVKPMRLSTRRRR